MKEGKTMYSMKDLRAEIAAKIDNLRSLGASDSELNPDWIAQNILNDHPDEGVDEFTVCTSPFKVVVSHQFSIRDRRLCILTGLFAK
jgi:hypothetical protein